MVVEGRARRERTYVYIEPIHFVVPKKLSQHWKAIILKKREKNYTLNMWLIWYFMGFPGDSGVKKIRLPMQEMQETQV